LSGRENIHFTLLTLNEYVELAAAPAFILLRKFPRKQTNNIPIGSASLKLNH